MKEESKYIKRTPWMGYIALSIASIFLLPIIPTEIIEQGIQYVSVILFVAFGGIDVALAFKEPYRRPLLTWAISVGVVTLVVLAILNVI